MPSTKPVIPVRLDQALYKQVVACAQKEGRSLSNFVEYLVRQHMELQKTKRA